jgi:hypothetical protein
VPDQQEDDDDRQRNAQKPQQYAFSHFCLLSMTAGLTVRRRNVLPGAEFRRCRDEAGMRATPKKRLSQWPKWKPETAEIGSIAELSVEATPAGSPPSVAAPAVV